MPVGSDSYISTVRPHQKVKVQRAKIMRVIFSWNTIDKKLLKDKYNRKAGVHYEEKIQYILDYIRIYP